MQFGSGHRRPTADRLAARVPRPAFFGATTARSPAWPTAPTAAGSRQPARHDGPALEHRDRPRTPDAQRPRRPVRDVVITPDGQRIISVGDDRTIKVWVAETFRADDYIAIRPATQ